MKTLKGLLCLCLLTFAYAATAQLNYEIHTTTTSEKFDKDGKLISRHLWSSGVQDNEVLNVDIIVDNHNFVKELTVNDGKINPLMLKEYKMLTDFVINYIDQDIQTAPTDGSSKTSRIVSEEPTGEKLTEEDKRALMALIKDELIKDALIDNPKVFDFLLTSEHLYINAKKQEEAVFIKYKNLYDKYSDIPLSKTTYFQMTQSL